MDLAEELRCRGLTQADLAEATGLDQSTISLIASGRSPGRPATLRLIRAALAGYRLAETGAAQAPPPSPPTEAEGKPELRVHLNPNRKRP